MTYAGQPQVPDGQDEQSDRGAAVLAAIWTYLSVTTVVLVLRFYAQIRIQRKTATDDYFMILAWVSILDPIRAFPLGPIAVVTNSLWRSLKS